MCIGIIRDNSLVGGCARAEAQTPTTEHVTVNCTWRLTVLTTGPHEQVQRQYHTASKTYFINKMSTNHSATAY